MSDSTTKFSFNQLPVEILHGILYYLDIPDILRIRRVSRYLNQVSHNREVWIAAYRSAKFIRPPGPFFSQSAHDLEDALVPSFRVDRNLRGHGDGDAQGERQAIKLREIRYTGVEVSIRLIFGRFLFIAFSKEVRCYDLNLDVFDSNSGASIIYRPTGSTLRSFHCASAIDIEGRPLACVVLNEETGSTRQISIYSFNVGEQSDMTLDLLHQFEHGVFTIDTVDLGPRVIVIQGRVDRGAEEDWRLVALDVHSRTQFLLSPFAHAPWEATEILMELAIIEGMPSISTSTHLLLARSFYTPAGWSTFFEAFALPPPDIHRRLASASTSISLEPSHRGTIPGINVGKALLLHDSILDPTTQDVLIAIRVRAFETTRPFTSLLRHGVLRLSSALACHDDPEIGAITFQLHGPLGQVSQMPFLHPSFNGTGRAFYTLEPGILSALEYDLHGSSSGDGEGEKHAATVTVYPSILRFPTPRRALLDYDPYFGRICLQSGMAKYSVIEILDLAV